MAGRRSRWTARVALTVLCTVWITPALGAGINTFRSSDDVNTSGWWTVLLHPSRLSTLSSTSLVQVFTGQSGLARALLNSIAISVPATVVPILVSTVTAYALVFMRFAARRLVFLLLLSVLVVPNQVAILPLLKLYAQLGIHGTFAAVWLALTGFAVPLNTFLLRAYLLRMRTDLVDCARLDGASEFQILWRVIVPLATPALVALTVFQFLASWNELFLTLAFIGPGPDATLPVALANSVTSLETLSAASLVTVAVPVTVFLLLQARLLGGLTFIVASD